jgi:hypothetical protein
MKSKEELFEEIEKLKEVNLVDFAVNTAGFQIDEERTKKENRNGSSPKYVFVQNEAGDKLLISRIYDNGRQQYVYKNLFNDFDKGNIFSFIKNRSENFSIPTAKKKIYNFEKNMETGYYKKTGWEIRLEGDDLKTNTEGSLRAMQRKYQVLPDFNDRTYLRSRGLSDEILSSHLCTNRIKNEIIYHPKMHPDTKPIVKYVNTVFPIYSSDGEKTFLCGYVRKNIGMKMTAEDSKQSIGVWASDYRRNEKITHLVLAENPIDALSYCQMHIDYKKDNPFLTASNGELTKSQRELYQEIVSRLRPDTIVLANDNNCKGQLFNAKVLSTLSFNQSDYDKDFYEKNKLIINADIHVGYKDKYNGELIWKFEHDKNYENISKDKFIEEHIPQFQKVVKYYEQANEELFLVNDEKYPFTLEKKYTDFHSEVKVSFHNLKVNWVEINKSIIDLKFNSSEKIKLEISKNIDFNDDLREKEGIIKFSNQQTESEVKNSQIKM